MFLFRIFQVFIIFFCLVTHSLKAVAVSPTLVAGDVSGIWSKDNSPYILTDNCTVNKGAVLTIEPGVNVIIGKDLKLNVYGQIIANGLAESLISFTSPVETQKWDQLYIYGYDSNDELPNEISYCKFSNAQTALYLYLEGQKINSWTKMEISIFNCIFEDSVNTAIYAEANSRDWSQYMTPKRLHAQIEPTIDRCQFRGNDKGIEMYIHGGCGTYCTSAQTSPLISNSFFLDITDTAFNIIQGDRSSGSPLLINNDIISCNKGFNIPSAFDAKIKNNIFYGNFIAIEKSGNLSTSTYYNAFSNNNSNFVGYPDTYGDIVIVNSNGTSCDIGYNIFVEPMLLQQNNVYKLTSISPCIDAGSSENAPDRDFESDIRPVGRGIDIGADEFVDVTLTNTPIAYNQLVSTDEGVAITITLNGFDPTGNNTLLYSIEKSVDHGVLIGTPPVIRYSPNQNFDGTDNFTFKVNNNIEDSNIANVSITIKRKFIDTDIYEPDNTYDTSKIIHLYDNIQQNEDILGYDWDQEHLFETEGDQDWVKIHGVKDEWYTISVKKPELNCDAVIEIYHPDGQTLLKTVNDFQEGQPEYVNFQAISNDIFYVKIKQFDPLMFGPGSGYHLTAVQSYLDLGVIIRGHVYDQSNNQPPLVETTIKSSSQIGACVERDDESKKGSFAMAHPPGTYIFVVEADGYISVKQEVTIPDKLTYLHNFYIVKDNNIPYANYFVPKTSGPAPLKVGFNEISSGRPFDLLVWDFGDGYTSTEEDPEHTYEKAGNYKATLTVARGNSQSVTEVNINVTSNSSGNGGSSGGGGSGGGCFILSLFK